MSGAGGLALIQIGLGDWGMNWFDRILSAQSEVRVVAGVDASPDRRRSTLGIPVYPSVDDAMREVDAEGALITTDGPSHGVLIEACLARGLDVLVEKPFVETAAEARRLSDLAAQLGRVLLVSQNYRYWGMVQAAREAIASGAIGPVRFVRIDFRMRRGPLPAENLSRVTTTPLYQLTTHHVDLLRHLIDEVVEVRARPWPLDITGSPFSAFSAQLLTESGIVVDYSLASRDSAAEPTPWSGAWTVEGASGVLEFAASPGDSPAYGRIVSGSGDVRLLAPKTLAHSDRFATLDEFVRAVRSGAPSEVSGSRNVPTIAIVEAVRRSLTSGRIESARADDLRR